MFEQPYRDMLFSWLATPKNWRVLEEVASLPVGSSLNWNEWLKICKHVQQKLQNPSSNYCSFLIFLWHSWHLDSLRYMIQCDSSLVPPSWPPSVVLDLSLVIFFLINGRAIKTPEPTKFQGFFPHPGSSLIPDPRPGFLSIQTSEDDWKRSSNLRKRSPRLARFSFSLVEVTSLNDWKVFSSVTNGISGQLATQFSTWCEYIWMHDANKKYISYCCLRSATEFC